MIRRVRPTAFLLCLVFVVPLIAAAQEPAPTPAQPTPPPPMATVGSSAITTDDWTSTLEAFSGVEALRTLIRERLIIQEAHRLRIPFKDAEVDAQIARMKATQYPDEGAFQDMLRARGISAAALRREVKTNLLLDRIVDEVGKISDAAVQAYYDSHLREFTKPTRVQLYGITVPDLRTAQLAFERLTTEDFGAVAQELSVDEHAAEGGFWGWLSAEQVEPETVRTAAFASDEGKVHEPIEADGKAYVIWVKGKEPGSQTSLTEAAPGIRDKLRAEKGISREAVLRGIYSRATITISTPEYAFLQQEYARAKEAQVIVDGTPLRLKIAPFTVPSTGRMVVPAEPLVKAVGAEWEWWEAERTMRVTKGDAVIVMKVDHPGAGVTRAGAAETAHTLDQPPVLRDGVPCVAPRWIVEQLGGSVLYLPAEGTLKVKSVKEAAPTPTTP